jgi:DNA repair protein SbcC/Rad50
VDDWNRQLSEELARLANPRSRQQLLLASAARAASLEVQLHAELTQEQREVEEFGHFAELVLPYERLDERIERQRSIEREHATTYELYLQHRQEASQADQRDKAVSGLESTLADARSTLTTVEGQLADTIAAYDAKAHAELRLRCEETSNTFAAEGQRQLHLRESLARDEKDLAFLRRQEEKLGSRRDERHEVERTVQAISFIRDTIKAAGPAVTDTLLLNISQIANAIYAEILDDHASELRWNRDYEVIVQRGAEERHFAQLSGGEQMSASLAVRLALLKEMSEIDFAFFDEPTQSMDSARRINLAGQISQVRGFDQLIVISHDDTFEHHTDHLIRLRKVDEETIVEG